MIFKIIHQKISLHKNLIIHSINIRVCMMVSNKIGYPVDHILIKPRFFSIFLCLCRTFLLLQFAVTSAKFSLRRAVPISCT